MNHTTIEQKFEVDGELETIKEFQLATSFRSGEAVLVMSFQLTSHFANGYSSMDQDCKIATKDHAGLERMAASLICEARKLRNQELIDNPPREIEHLLKLAEKLRHIPGTYDIDDGDIDLVRDVIELITNNELIKNSSKLE